ncbi:WD40-repeat-containing domain protein [Cladochytrium replicatum]|nr:WD40-repeat-containing domain protein [Cladochytrium replicatum]
MSEFQKLQLRKFPKPVEKKTVEAGFWRKFKSSTVIKTYGPVTHISFSPVAPHDFAISASARVQVYSPNTNELKKSVTRFKDVAYSGSYRSDGVLLVAGDATGLVQIFELKGRAVLRTLEGHDGPVRSTKFSLVKTEVLSGGDDRTVRLWDIPTGSATSLFDEHQDYVRSVVVNPVSPHILASGSYDHTVRVWDSRSKSGVLKVDHGAPVESIVVMPGGSLIASAGSNNIKIWDINAGGRLIQTLSNNQKTVTTLSLNVAGTRLLSGSLDHHLKVYSLHDYKVVHSAKYPAPILCAEMSPDDSHLVVGMTNSLVSVRRRKIKTIERVREVQRTGARQGLTPAEWFTRGVAYTPDETDVRIESRRRKRLKPYEKFLKSFQYGNALDSALSTNQSVLVIVSLLEELIHRDGLRRALAGRDDISLEPLARFLLKNIDNPRYSSLLIAVTNMVLDMYWPVIGQSTIIDDIFTSLRFKLIQELKLQEKLMETMGLLEAILSTAAL